MKYIRQALKQGLPPQEDRSNTGMEDKPEGYRFGKFFLEDDHEKKRLRHDDGGITILSPRDFATLRRLLKSDNVPVLKKDLYFKNDDVDNDVEKSIGHLRKLLFDDFREPKYIKTLDKGYAFIAKITRSSKSSPQLELTDLRAHSNFFDRWLFDSDNRQLVFGVVGCLAAAVAASVLGGFFIKMHALTIVSAIQALIIFFAAQYKVNKEGLGKKKEDEAFWDGLDRLEKDSTACESFPEWRKRSRIGENILREYRRKWRWILLSWASLYFCIFVMGLTGVTSPDSNAAPAVKIAFAAFGVLNTTLNNFTTGTIFVCFVLLNSPTKLGDDDQPQTSDLVNKVILTIVAFLAVECAFIYWVGGFNGSLQEAKETLDIFSGISGVAAAAVYAQYFGRLQSNFLNPPSWLITFLFIYMAIQPLFFFLDEGPGGLILMVLALFFKSLLFLYTVFLFRTGKLLFYLIRARKTYESIEVEYDTFNGILRK